MSNALGQPCTTCGGGSASAVTQSMQPPAGVVYETSDPLPPLDLVDGRLVDPASGGVAIVPSRSAGVDAAARKVFEYKPSIVAGPVRIVWSGSVALVPPGVAQVMVGSDYARLATSRDIPAPPAAPVPSPAASEPVKSASKPKKG